MRNLKMAFVEKTYRGSWPNIFIGAVKLLYCDLPPNNSYAFRKFCIVKGFVFMF